MDDAHGGHGARCGAAALAALGSYETLTHITGFLPGLPALLAEFLHENNCMWSEESCVGMVPRLAIRRAEQRILEAVCRLHERGDCVFDERISLEGSMQEACKCGNLAALQWLLQPPRLGHLIPPDLLDTAILHGHTAIVQWLYACCPSGCTMLTSHATDSTAQSSRLGLFEWIQRQQLAAFTSGAMAVAIRTGSQGIVETLHTIYGLGCGDMDAVVAAVDHNFVSVLEYIVENKVLSDPVGAILTAYKRDKPSLAQQLLRLSIAAHVIKDTVALRCAAQVGSLEMLQTLWGGADLVSLEDAVAQAVRSGHIDVLRFLVRVYPAGIKPELLNEAIHHGNLEIVRYLIHDRGLACSDVALNIAAVHGYSDLVSLIVRETNVGCLFYARRLAQRAERDGVVAQLTETLDPYVRYCELKLHSRDPTARRLCERKQPRRKGKWRVW